MTEQAAQTDRASRDRSVSIDWYAEGQSRTVEVGGIRVTVRFVARKGRRARIVIDAPASANFFGADRIRNQQDNDFERQFAII